MAATAAAAKAAAFDEADGTFVRSVLAGRAKRVEKEKRLANFVRKALKEKTKQKARAMAAYARRRRAEMNALINARLGAGDAWIIRHRPAPVQDLDDETGDVVEVVVVD